MSWYYLIGRDGDQKEVRKQHGGGSCSSGNGSPSRHSPIWSAAVEGGKIPSVRLGVLIKSEPLRRNFGLITRPASSPLTFPVHEARTTVVAKATPYIPLSATICLFFVLPRQVAIKEKSIPKTTSGKIQRRLTRTMLHGQDLAVISEIVPDPTVRWFSCRCSVLDSCDDTKKGSSLRIL